jgi:hypothetical protein
MDPELAAKYQQEIEVFKTFILKIFSIWLCFSSINLNNNFLKAAKNAPLPEDDEDI